MTEHNLLSTDTSVFSKSDLITSTVNVADSVLELNGDGITQILNHFGVGSALGEKINVHTPNSYFLYVSSQVAF